MAAELTQSLLGAGLDSAAQMNPTKDPGVRVGLLRVVGEYMCADDVVKAKLYSAYPKYADQVDPEAYETIIYDLSSLTETAISEAYWLSRSAVNFAEQKGRKDLRATAQRSTGMLEAARCDQTGIRKVQDELGKPIDPEHLVMKSTGNRLVTVEFGPAATRLIQDNLSPLGGCPARRLPDTISQPGKAVEGDSLIQAYYRSFTKFVFAGM